MTGDESYVARPKSHAQEGVSLKRPYCITVSRLVFRVQVLSPPIRSDQSIYSFSAWAAYRQQASQLSAILDQPRAQCTRYKVMNNPAVRSCLQKIDQTVSRAWYRRYAPQSRRSKAHRSTTNIHRITKHIEGEALDAGSHKNTRIFAQEGARDKE